MRLQYLGTAAAEGWPAIFCECAACKKAEALGGKNIRMRSGAFVNDRLLIDVPPDLYAEKLRFHLDLSVVRHIVITHSHSDHFDRETLGMFMEPFAHLTNRGPLHLYGSAFTEKVWHEYGALALLKGSRVNEEVTFRVIKPFETFTAEGITFTALPAAHGCPESLIYILEQGGAKFLYGNDTGLWSEDVWAFLQQSGTPFTHVSLDGTLGDSPSAYTGHMTFSGNAYVRERMLSTGIAAKDTRFITTHFSHNIALTHGEMETLMNPKGFTVAYDGMIVE